MRESEPTDGASRNWRFSPKHFAAWLVVVTIIGSALAYFTALPTWGAMAIVAAALVINGVVAQVADISPGGFLSQKVKASKRAEPPPGDA
jgi:Na+/melibiose symporter-like transporter